MEALPSVSLHEVSYPATLKNVASLILRAGQQQEPNPFNFRLNEFTGAIHRNGKECEEWDWIDAAIQLDINFAWSGAAPGKLRTRDAILWASSIRKFHPVREFLSAARKNWDGKPRVSSFLTRYCGVDYDKPTLREAQSSALLVGAVARIMKPGCKHDLVPVFISPQGWGKSTLVRLLATRGEWYSDTVPDLRTKDSLQGLIGCWIYEIAEMRSILAASQEQVKAFITSQVDRFRKPYGTDMMRHPRQVTFWGTSNELELRDHTGGRRFWPLQLIRRPDLAAIERDMFQIWGEAVALYESGAPWWLQADTDQDRQNIEELQGEQAEYQTEDPWVDVIRRFWLECERGSKVDFQIVDVLTWAGIPTAQQTQRQVLRVSRLLKSAGFENTRYRKDGKRMRKWVKK